MPAVQRRVVLRELSVNGIIGSVESAGTADTGRADGLGSAASALDLGVGDVSNVNPFLIANAIILNNLLQMTIDELLPVVGAKLLALYPKGECSSHGDKNCYRDPKTDLHFDIGDKVQRNLWAPKIVSMNYMHPLALTVCITDLCRFKKKQITNRPRLLLHGLAQIKQ
jgi:hypothetical protein